MQIDALKAKAVGNHASGTGAGTGAGAGGGAGAGQGAGQTASSNPQPAAATAGSDNTLDALKKLQQQMDEVNAVLAKIESQISSTKKK
jgi:hypothetical protein